MRIIHPEPLIATAVWIGLLIACGWLAVKTRHVRARLRRRLKAAVGATVALLRRLPARPARSLFRPLRRAYLAFLDAEPTALVVLGLLVAGAVTAAGFREFGDQGFAGNLAAEAVGIIAGSLIVGAVIQYAQTRADVRRWGEIKVYVHRQIGFQLAAICNAIARQRGLDPDAIRSKPLAQALEQARESLAALPNEPYRLMMQSAAGDRLREDVLTAVREVERLSVLYPGVAAADPGLLARVSSVGHQALIWRYWSDPGTPKGGVDYEWAWGLAAPALGWLLDELVELAKRLQHVGEDVPLVDRIDLSQLEVLRRAA